MSEDIISSKDTTYTDRARPNRGYHDYNTRVVFKPGVSSTVQWETMTALKDELAKTSMWAWTPLNVAASVWTINHGYDSGD